MRNLRISLGVCGLLVLLFLQLFFSARRNSITWDEDDHIYSGYMSWKHADFGLNPEHPPLVKLVATLPLLGMSLRVPPLQNRFFKLEAFLGGKDFLFKNDADMILLRSRMAASIFTLMLGLLVFLAAKEMFGTPAGFIALSLLVFDPNLVAHGALVTTDVALSGFMFASVYAFFRYVRAPSAWRLVIAGFAAGLALTAKHTGILVFPILLLLAICEVLFISNKSWEAVLRRSAVSKLKRLTVALVRLTVALVLIGSIAIGILWACYGFRYRARAGDRQLNPPLTEYVHNLSRPREVRVLDAVARLRLLPESYIYGLADVRIMSDFYASYLLGKDYPHGVWFYFPVALAIKSTLSFLILFLLALWAIRAGRFDGRREILFLTIPPFFYFIVAMSSGMNIGVRHILPIYIFFMVLIGGASARLIGQDRRWTYVVVALLIFQAISTTRAYPAYLAYANELWRGPSQTYRLLSDSNADWAQQLKDVKQYLDQNAIKDCWFVYFGEGVIDEKYYGIHCHPLPTMDSLWVNEPINAPPAIDGTVLVSAGDLSGFEFGEGALNPYEQFKSLRPVAVIDYGVFVYEGHFEIPLAASISHCQKSQDLLEAHHYDEALAEAQQALAFAPNAVKPNALMGDILAAKGNASEARTYYERALTLARTVEPDFQIESGKEAEKKLAAVRQ